MSVTVINQYITDVNHCHHVVYWSAWVDGNRMRERVSSAPRLRSTESAAFRKRPSPTLPRAPVLPSERSSATLPTSEKCCSQAAKHCGSNLSAHSTTRRAL